MRPTTVAASIRVPLRHGLANRTLPSIEMPGKISFTVVPEE
jgi:hypothetical protein